MFRKAQLKLCEWVRSLFCRTDKGYVKIPMDVYVALWDFIFNCCVIHKKEAPGFFYKWEEERIDCLAEFFDECERRLNSCSGKHNVNRPN